jgi:hypothetical protein
LDAQGNPFYSEQVNRIQHCAEYAELPEVYGFCLVQIAGLGRGSISADELCLGAGSWEDDCRDSWVASRSSPHSKWDWEVLVAACPKKKPDCRFEVLDSRPHADVTVQMERCFEHAGPFSSDCIAHALARWVRQEPAVEEIERVSQFNIAPDRIGSYLFAIKKCYGTIDTCIGGPKVLEACLSSERERATDSELCQRLFQSPGIPQVPMGP